MPDCSSGVHPEPRSCARLRRLRLAGSADGKPDFQVGKIEEKYGVDFGARDDLHLETLLGRKKVDSLSLLLEHGPSSGRLPEAQ